MSLYVGNLPRDLRSRELEDLFEKYGRIRYCEVKSGRGFGFVEFDDTRDAEDAIDALDGTNFEGGRIRVEFSRKRVSSLATCVIP
jgi:arginine/serine-rich splicing factor 1/9